MYLEILDNIQRKICNIIGTDLVSLLHSLYYPRQLAFSIYFFHCNFTYLFSSLVRQLHEFKRSNRLADTHGTDCIQEGQRKTTLNLRSELE